MVHPWPFFMTFTTKNTFPSCWGPPRYFEYHPFILRVYCCCYNGHSNVTKTPWTQKAVRLPPPRVRVSSGLVRRNNFVRSKLFLEDSRGDKYSWRARLDKPPRAFGDPPQAREESVVPIPPRKQNYSDFRGRTLTVQAQQKLFFVCDSSWSKPPLAA